MRLEYEVLWLPFKVEVADVYMVLYTELPSSKQASRSLLILKWHISNIEGIRKTSKAPSLPAKSCFWKQTPRSHLTQLRSSKINFENYQNGLIFRDESEASIASYASKLIWKLQTNLNW